MKRPCTGKSNAAKLQKGGLKTADRKSADMVRKLRAQVRELNAELAGLKARQEEIIQNERLHALGQMASGLVHDFNNALTPILGASDFLVMNPQMLDRRTDAMKLIESIKTSAHDAKKMVMQLREFYRPKEDLAPQRVNLNSIADDVALLTRPKWREEACARGARIRMKLDLRDIPDVVASDSQLRELLMNLVLNSIDAIEGDGAITVGTSHSNGTVAVTVSDTGKGMTEEVRRRCFEPFFSTKGRNGTGMGLAMVYGIVKKYHGSIRIESEVGRGTMFEISLPAATDESATVPEPVAAPVQSMDVLIYDSDALSREIFAKCLRNDGHKVVAAASVGEAERKIKSKRFDIVVVDVATPGCNGNGVEFARAVKMKKPGTGTILMSGSSLYLKDDAQRIEGVDVILPKPATISELRGAISDAAQKIRDYKTATGQAESNPTS